jgi:iron complex transport system ATP-binding protein
MRTDGKTILSLESLKIGYTKGARKDAILPPINASACRNELVAVIGRNGIGKSTLLRTVTGIQKSLGGKISINNKNLNDYSKLQLAHNIGYISTEAIKVSNMRVYDLVVLGRFPHTNWFGKIDPVNHQAVIDSLEKTGMLSFYDRFVTELSDGERQRVMIARVLAQDTAIMIMDEPTAFLDISSKYEIIHLMNELARYRGKTIIYSTHDLETAISQTDKIWLLLDDQLREGAPEDLILEGSFEHLFDSSKVSFNSGNGTLSIKKDEKESVFVEGEGAVKYWTEKAVNRAGFSIAKEKRDTVVRAPSEKNTKWVLLREDLYLEFGSIYELVAFLII